MKLKKISKVIGVVAVASMAAFSTVGASAQSADSSLLLTINPGVLTMYAGDGTDNNDICTATNNANEDTVEVHASGQAVATVTCAPTESELSMSALNVASVRQSTTGTMSDILFEDLRGVSASTYTITATASDYTASGGKVIPLGQNPDGVTADSVATGYSCASGTNLFTRINPSSTTPQNIFTVLRDATTIAEVDTATELVEAAATCIQSTATTASVFATPTAIRPGRIDFDNMTVESRVQSYVQAGSYTSTMTFTITPGV
jgi:hypothetical protein